MAETHETIANIIAEKRVLADRLEHEMAVAKECKELIAHRTAQAIIDGTRREADRLEAARKRELGDVAKLREAMKHIKDRLPHILQYMRVHWEDASSGGYFDELMLVIDVALAAPPRNCDVGNAEEQTRRFMEFCIKHDECMKQAGKCPVFKKLGACKLEWAQMPYEEGGAR